MLHRAWNSEENTVERRNNSKVLVVQSVLHTSAALGGRCARLCTLTASENKLITTSRQLPPEEPDGLSPSSSVIILCYTLRLHSSLSPLPFLPLIHFSPAVYPFFNRCHYEEDASALNTNPSFDAVLKDYSDAWVCPGIKIAWRSVSMSNKAFPWMTCHKKPEKPRTCCALFGKVTMNTS